MNHPEFYYRSIAYIENSRKVFLMAKHLFQDQDKAESFSNYVVMHSSEFRKEGFSGKRDCRCVAAERIGCRKVFSILAKVFINYIFRLLYGLKGRNKYKSSRLVKTWVELNYFTYKARLEGGGNGLVLVLPFALNFKRQVAYIRLLKALGVNFAFYGAGYSIIDVVIFLAKRDMLSLFNLEYKASQKTREDFCKYVNLSEYLVMDDVDPFANSVNKSLHSGGVKVLCTMHGVGTYSPFYFASEVFLFNQAQAEYYRYFRPELATKVQHCPRSLVLPMYFDRIVFYSGVSVTTSGLNSMVELRVLSALVELCKRNSISIQVKLHPNYKGVKRYVGVESFDGVLTDSTLNLSLYSTSYYTVDIGKSALIETDEIPTSLLFGEGEAIIKEADIGRLFSGGGNC